MDKSKIEKEELKYEEKKQSRGRRGDTSLMLELGQEDMEYLKGKDCSPNQKNNLQVSCLRKQGYK